MITEMKIHKEAKFTRAVGRCHISNKPSPHLVVETDNLPSKVFLDLERAIWGAESDPQKVQAIRGNNDLGPMVSMVHWRFQKWFDARLIGVTESLKFDVFGSFDLLNDKIRVRATDGGYSNVWWTIETGRLALTGNSDDYRLEIENFLGLIQELYNELRPLLISSAFYWQCKRLHVEPLHLEAEEKARELADRMTEIDNALQNQSLLEIV